MTDAYHEQATAEFSAWDVHGAGLIKTVDLRQVLKELNPNFSDADIEMMLPDQGSDRRYWSSFLTWLFESSEESDAPPGAKKEPLPAPAAAEVKAERPAPAPEAAAPAAPSQLQDWHEVLAKIPYEKERRKEREDLFTKCVARTGDAHLDEQEAILCMRGLLKVDHLLDVKPVIMSAFEAAKNFGSTSSFVSQKVQWKEFRVFLKFLHDYFEILLLFNSIDASSDLHLDLSEFKAALPTLAKWGVNTIEHPEREFRRIDASRNGSISFLEFSRWCINKNLHLELPDD